MKLSLWSCARDDLSASLTFVAKFHQSITASIILSRKKKNVEENNMDPSFATTRVFTIINPPKSARTSSYSTLFHLSYVPCPLSLFDWTDDEDGRVASTLFVASADRWWNKKQRKMFIYYAWFCQVSTRRYVKWRDQWALTWRFFMIWLLVICALTWPHVNRSVLARVLLASVVNGEIPTNKQQQQQQRGRKNNRLQSLAVDSVLGSTYHF